MENQHGFFSRKLRAGKRRTYFFDVRSTKQGDYFVTITESKRKFDRSGYDSHKIFLYKEDFQSFKDSLDETINHIKTELNPDFDYDAYNREVYQEQVEENRSEDEETSVEDNFKNDVALKQNSAKPLVDSSDQELNDEAMSW